MTVYVRPNLPFLDDKRECRVCGHVGTVHLPDAPPFYGDGTPTPGNRPYYRAHCDVCLKQDLDEFHEMSLEQKAQHQDDPPVCQHLFWPRPEPAEAGQLEGQETDAGA